MNRSPSPRNRITETDLLLRDLEQILSALLFNFYFVTLALGKASDIFTRCLAVDENFIVVLFALHCLLSHHYRHRARKPSCIYHNAPPICFAAKLRPAVKFRLSRFRCCLLFLDVSVDNTDECNYYDTYDNSDLACRCRAFAA